MVRRLIILFVCKANLNRSPRAAEVFKKLCERKLIENVKIISAGTRTFGEVEPGQFKRTYGIDSITQLTEDLIEKADKIFVLDDFIQSDIQRFNPKSKEVINLRVPDNYSKPRGNIDELDILLNKKLRAYIDEF